MTASPLFYLSPEWDEQGRLIRHSLVWNALDGHHAKDASWYEAFDKRQALAEGWAPPTAMLELNKQSGDFLAACDKTFAVSPKAWKAIQDLVKNTAEALPVNVTRLIDPAKFNFPAIAAAKQPTYFLLHGLFNVPMRHSQSGYWDVTRNRYNMSMGRFHGAPPDRCQLLWLDPQEFVGKHLFLVDGEWVASAEFAERVQAKKLTGLVLHPIKYRAMSRPVIKPLKRIISAPPKPDFLAAAKGFSPAIGKQWLALWNWTVEALMNRGWPARKPKLKAPISAKELRAFEAKHSTKIPRDYAAVLTRFASSVTVEHGWVKPGDPPHDAWEEIHRKIRELMFGGKTELWSFDVPMKQYTIFKKWGDQLADMEPEDEYYQHFRNKLPILAISNGDYIALDLKTGVPTYISHEGDDWLQGKPLGKNFVDFVTRWSWACLPWPDFLPGTDFYDEESQALPQASPTLARWHAWLRGVPLPVEKE